jgi:Transposase DDE domain group 1
VHFTTFVTEKPLPHMQRALDELHHCSFDLCALTMAPGRAGSEVRSEFRPQLYALARNLAAFMRGIETPEAMAAWSLAGVQLNLVKIGARMVRHVRAITFQLAGVAVIVGKQLVDSLGNSQIQIDDDGGGNKSTRLTGAPSNPNHEPSAETQQLEEMQ